jgi:hypothetical protein
MDRMSDVIDHAQHVESMKLRCEALTEYWSVTPAPISLKKGWFDKARYACPFCKQEGSLQVWTHERSSMAYFYQKCRTDGCDYERGKAQKVEVRVS